VQRWAIVNSGTLTSEKGNMMSQDMDTGRRDPNHGARIQGHASMLHRNPLLHRYPVLLPVLLLLAALLLGVASVLSEQFFPVLAFFGIPYGLLCLSISLVLAIVAILIAIIGLIERLDRPALTGHATAKAARAGTIAKVKGAEL